MEEASIALFTLAPRGHRWSLEESALRFDDEEDLDEIQSLLGKEEDMSDVFPDIHRSEHPLNPQMPLPRNRRPVDFTRQTVVEGSICTIGLAY